MAGQAHLTLVIDLLEVVAVVLLKGKECSLPTMHLIVFLRDSKSFPDSIAFFLSCDSNCFFDLNQFRPKAHHIILKPFAKDKFTKVRGLLIIQSEQVVRHALLECFNEGVLYALLLYFFLE